MSWLVYHRSKDDKYRLYSTIAEGFITKWDTRENIKNFWILQKFENDKEKVEEYLNNVDKEV